MSDSVYNVWDHLTTNFVTVEKRDMRELSVVTYALEPARRSIWVDMLYAAYTGGKQTSPVLSTPHPIVLFIERNHARARMLPTAREKKNETQHINNLYTSIYVHKPRRKLRSVREEGSKIRESAGARGCSAIHLPI